MTEILYAQTRHPMAAGRTQLNPRFFAATIEGATRVLILGDWPKIRAAYEALGVPVERLDEEAAIASPTVFEAAEALVQAVPADERASVYIPDDWRELGWTRPSEGRDLTLRGLAAMFSDAPVLNKAQAVEAIEAELERRAGAQSAE